LFSLLELLSKDGQALACSALRSMIAMLSGEDLSN